MSTAAAVRYVISHLIFRRRLEQKLEACDRRQCKIRTGGVRRDFPKESARAGSTTSKWPSRPQAHHVPNVGRAVTRRRQKSSCRLSLANRADNTDVGVSPGYGSSGR